MSDALRDRDPGHAPGDTHYVGATDQNLSPASGEGANHSAALIAVRIVFAVTLSMLAHFVVGGHDGTVGLVLLIAAWFLSGAIISRHLDKS